MECERFLVTVSGRSVTVNRARSKNSKNRFKHEGGRDSESPHDLRSGNWTTKTAEFFSFFLFFFFVIVADQVLAAGMKKPGSGRRRALAGCGVLGIAEDLLVMQSLAKVGRILCCVRVRSALSPFGQPGQFANRDCVGFLSLTDN